mgnify:CR=1 FL=1
MTKKEREQAIQRIVNLRLQAQSLEDLMEMFKEAETKTLSEIQDADLEEVFKDEFGYGIND